MSSEADRPGDARARLLTYFENRDPDTHASHWENLWTDNFIPFDKGFPSPSLVDLLSTRAHLPPPQLAPPSGDKARPGQRIRRLRALVPGCGKGYDVLLFASHGYDSYGVESAPSAIKQAEELRKGYELKREEYKVWDEKVGRGEVKYLEGDFFKDEWWEQVCQADTERKTGFDIIYDYTFFCAMPPALRHRWAARMAQLLAPGGRLICLEFPTYKPPSTGGPPWAVRSNEYVAYLSKPGEKVQYDSEGLVTEIDVDKPARSSNGLVRMAHWKPERTHDIGKDTDRMSVWTHQ